MEGDVIAASAARFASYVGELTNVIGHADRCGPLRDYCAGLLVAEGRKSVEPMAAVTAPARVSAQHQKLLHFVATAPWADASVMAKVRELVLPQIERHGPVEVWIMDDTSYPKQGSHSVGVHHQYCGQLGKQANCQVAVTLSIANHHASLPIAYRLYLPQPWADDAARRRRAHVPPQVAFQTKPQIALEQIRAACAAGVPRGTVLMDASYGANATLRDGISDLGLTYVAAVVPNLKVVRSVAAPAASQPRLSVKQLALALPQQAWRTIAWREGTNERLQSRFARVQVRTSPTRGRRSRPQQTLLIEWPKAAAAPTKYWLATLDQTTSFRRLVDIAKMRWRIERDYQELKQEIGLGHYEGRGWVGFHHHATLCIAAYGFLLGERETIPPCAPAAARTREKPAVPNGYRPRGTPAATAAARSQLDSDAASPVDRGHRQSAATMSMLCAPIPTEALCFVTQ
jgi:SRSO17 transposase